MSQKIAKSETIDHDFHARFSGTCARCGESFGVGTVVVKSVRGYRHAVCPRDVPLPG